MITRKKPKEIDIMRTGGKILATVLHEVVKVAQPGVSLKSLDAFAYDRIVEAGAVPAFLGYGKRRGQSPYPATLCVSVNDEVVHGIGNRQRMLQEGDIAGLDLGLRYPKNNGLYTDMAVSVGVGTISKERKRLIQTTKNSLDAAIALVRPGVTTRELSHAIQTVCENEGFSVIRDLTGHGIGYALHEDPPILCYVNHRAPIIMLEEGMVICIEPMVCAGDWAIIVDNDQWTIRTADGQPSAHFEHTIAVTKDGYAILTAL